MATLRTLECLIAVVDHGTISAAASALSMSQLALTHQITVLEEELGLRVIERLRQGVSVTTAGSVTAEQARIAIAAADRAVVIGRRVGVAAGGRLRLACVETMTSSLLLPVLRQWRLHHPDVQLELSEFASADAMAEALDEGRFDLAVGPRPTEANSHVEVLGQEEIVVVTAAAHRFSQTASVEVNALADEPFVHYTPESGFAVWIDRLAARHGVMLDVALRTRSPRTGAHLAAAGMGITVVPASALAARPPGAVRRLRPVIKRDVVAMAAVPSDTLVQRFLDDLCRRGLPAWSGPN